MRKMNAAKINKLGRKIYSARYLYLLLLPGLLYYAIFHYMPIAGLQIAFKNYMPRQGFWGSPFVGLFHYEFLFRDPKFYAAIRNTLVLSFLRIIFQLPCPLILALLINEIRALHLKRTLQTVFSFPNFLSWVILGGIFVNFLGEAGIMNSVLSMLGFEKVSFLSSTRLFYPILITTDIWKSAGWGSIIYLAAISGISQEQYEAATIDGANRFQKMIFITLPSIQGTFMIMIILAFGNVMNAGFDQIFNMTNPAVTSVSEILDMYIYRITFNGPTDFGFSTAVALFKSIINFAMLLFCDRVVKLMGGKGLYY
jgi:putative aldouronate transport system permease protein